MAYRWPPRCSHPGCRGYRHAQSSELCRQHDPEFTCCRAYTRDGTPCNNPAKGDGLCWLHSERHITPPAPKPRCDAEGCLGWRAAGSDHCAAHVALELERTRAEVERLRAASHCYCVRCAPMPDEEVECGTGAGVVEGRYYLGSGFDPDGESE